LALDKVEQKIRKLDDHQPITKLVCIENTHNRCGGRVLTESYMSSLSQLCKKHKLKLHLDGARLMNASVALGVHPSKLAYHADSASICLSKGLASPVGSVIVGDAEFIRLARRFRKALGGGLRQVGVLAACGIVSINTMIDRLKYDHHHAKLLAAGMNKIVGLSCDEKKVETNILFVSIDPNLISITAPTICQKMKEQGILIVPDSLTPSIRFVTHYHITKADVLTILNKLQMVIQPFTIKSRL